VRRRAPPPAGDRATQQELQRLYDQAILAYRARDLDRLLTAFAPGFTAQSLDGAAFGRADLEGKLERQFAAQAQVKTFRLEILKVAGTASEVTATVTLHLTLTLSDPQGRSGDLILRLTSLDTWTRTPGGWKLLRWEQLTNDTGGAGPHAGDRRVPHLKWRRQGMPRPGMGGNRADIRSGAAQDG
jgi:ketosteroid isomerase-like protein